MRRNIGRAIAQLAREAQLVYGHDVHQNSGRSWNQVLQGLTGCVRASVAGTHGMHTSWVLSTQEVEPNPSALSSSSSSSNQQHSTSQHSSSATAEATSHQPSSARHLRGQQRRPSDALYAQLDSLSQSNNPQGVRERFDAALKAALDQMREAGPGAAPPPQLCSAQNWRLYLLALDEVGAHPLLVGSRIHTMHEYGVPPMEHAYWVLFRRCLAYKAGATAFQKFSEMQEKGISPSLSCYSTAIMACLKSDQLGYANRLFRMVAEGDVAYNSQQLANYGKVSMYAVREFAREGRFIPCFGILDDMEAKGLVVPHLLITDIMHQAVLQRRGKDLLTCIQRLLNGNHHIQDEEGRSVRTVPLKMDEGSVLEVLEVAANLGDAELAEAAWKLITRSLALPNNPNVQRSPGTKGGDLDLEEDLSKGVHLEKDLESSEVTDPPSQQLGGGGAVEHANEDAAGSAGLPPASDAVSASDPSPDSPQPGEQQHVGRPPQVFTYQALIHAMAKAGKFKRMFEAVRELQEVHPKRPGALAYHEALQPAVDALAHGVNLIDDAYYMLEDMAKSGERVTAAMLNIVVAACSQVGDIKRGLETFDQYEALGAQPNTDSYNALMQGCVETGALGTMDKIVEEMKFQDVPPNAHTHQLLVESHIVTADVAGMMEALVTMEEAGHVPSTRLLERCVARCERAGDRDNMKPLLERLFTNDYRIVGLDALVKRWNSEGGMPMLTGSSSWVSREELAPSVLSAKGRYFRPRWHSRGSRPMASDRSTQHQQ